MSSQGKAHRRSLKECLKAILQRRRGDDDHITLGSGIIRRSNASLALLPAFGSLSSLPDFGSSRFDIDQFSIAASDRSGTALTRIAAANCSQHTIVARRSGSSLSQRDINDAYHFQSELGQLAKFCSDESFSNYSDTSLDLTRFNSNSARQSMRFRQSLNQITVPDSICFQSPLTQLAHACNVPSIYRQGVSQQASLVTLDPFVRSRSTLRLRRSTPTLGPVQDKASSPLSSRKVLIGSPIEEISCSDLERSYPPRSRSGRMPSNDDTKTTPEQDHRNQKLSDVDTGFSGINHFSSFCVLDAAQPGCPLTAVSEDLRHVFDIGEDFCLNTAEVDGADMDTIIGQDAEGNTIIHLVVYSPLVNPNSGRSRFVLASLLDITSFITETALVPDLETISEESVFEEELKTPPRISIQYSPPYELSTENLLSDCFHPEQNLHTPTQHHKDDIWLDIASEETRKSRSIRSFSSTARSHSASSSHSMDDTLDQFLVSLQMLYSEFFLLGKSPLDEYSYEICNVSPKVHTSREYVEGHLTKTSFADRLHLERKLTKERAFCTRVRWGSDGELKQLYCIPLFGRSNITWICFLVDEDKCAGLPVWD